MSLTPAVITPAEPYPRPCLCACLQARQRSTVLAEKVVDPSNTTRIRLLGGRIPEKEELVAKLQVGLHSMVDWQPD